MPNPIVGRIFVECCQHRRTAKWVGAPGVGAFAIIQTCKEVGSSHHSRHGNAITQSLAEDNHVRFEALAGQYAQATEELTRLRDADRDSQKNARNSKPTSSRKPRPS